MRTNIVLIDAENVKPDYIENLKFEFFRVVVFIGAQQKCLDFEIVNAVQSLGTNGSYVQVSKSGRDALDFHIAYYIGKFSAETAGAYFHIISKDTGYDPLIDHLKTQKVFCSRWASVLDIPLVKSGGKLPPKPCTALTQRAADFYKKCIAPGKARPTAVTPLQNRIRSHFHKSRLTAQEVTNVINELKACGYITVNENKIAYPNQR